MLVETIAHKYMVFVQVALLLQIPDIRFTMQHLEKHCHNSENRICS